LEPLKGASAEQLPLADACVDQALLNGFFNLNPFRDRIFSEPNGSETRKHVASLEYAGFDVRLGRPDRLRIRAWL